MSPLKTYSQIRGLISRVTINSCTKFFLPANGWGPQKTFETYTLKNPALMDRSFCYHRIKRERYTEKHFDTMLLYYQSSISYKTLHKFFKGYILLFIKSSQLMIRYSPSYSFPLGTENFSYISETIFFLHVNNSQIEEEFWAPNYR